MSYDKSLTLKEKQFDVLKALFEGSDVIANLPTGYGKSLHESSARFLKMTAFPGREIKPIRITATDVSAVGECRIQWIFRPEISKH